MGLPCNAVARVAWGIEELRPYLTKGKVKDQVRLVSRFVCSMSLINVFLLGNKQLLIVARPSYIAASLPSWEAETALLRESHEEVASWFMLFSKMQSTHRRCKMQDKVFQKLSKFFGFESTLDKWVFLFGGERKGQDFFYSSRKHCLNIFCGSGFLELGGILVMCTVNCWLRNLRVKELCPTSTEISCIRRLLRDFF